ncbi:PIN domain-containing protein [Methylobacterium brachythecii]|uniref:PIN domain-containing protein n=1 Tax=Methylobacterium brachythecii TaxID=1176177 RepID=A0A7W6AIF7_9HYPH|nr:PIN domain-containing protein [Methylobacterium brachythecii]MBB3903938.1 hypothetical protein [Methylobacterium brachythecii]GLS42685.1 hypothetical protein GCM10007884_06700 [Methylobacterium brachythecii]
MIYFPDTNFLLHFKDPQDIDWSVVTQDRHVRIAICSNTQREIDKMKFDLRGRAQKRARSWSSTIGDMIEADEPLELRSDGAAGPRITVELHLEWPPKWSPPKDLDTSRLGDDNFIADVLAFQAAYPDESVALITADTGPLGKARRHNLPAIRPSKFDWELPQEADDRERKIQHLEKQLKAANEQGPSIVARIAVDGSTASKLTIPATTYLDLSQHRIEEMLAGLQERHPRTTGFTKPGPDYEAPPPATPGRLTVAHLRAPFDWKEPTEQEISEYGAAYDGWIADARTLIETLPGQLQQRSFEVVFELEISNDGSEPAKDVIVSIEAKGALLLRHDAEKDGDADPPAPVLSLAKAAIDRRLRQPPVPPAWTKVFRSEPVVSPNSASTLAVKAGSLAGMAARDQIYGSALARAGLLGGTLGSSIFPHEGVLSRALGRSLDADLISRASAFAPTRFDTSPLDLIPRSRDPEVFYWQRTPERLDSTWEFECRLFRHGIAPETWTVPVVVSVDDLSGGAVEIEVHATNLRHPKRIKIPVRVAVEPEDTEAVLRELLP